MIHRLLRADHYRGRGFARYQFGLLEPTTPDPGDAGYHCDLEVPLLREGVIDNGRIALSSSTLTSSELRTQAHTGQTGDVTKIDFAIR